MGNQVDIIKPNLSELRVLMTECCLHRDMSIAKKSLILKTLKKGPIDPTHSNYLVDVRILAAGLLHVMMTVPTGAHHRPSHDQNPQFRSSDCDGNGGGGGEGDDDGDAHHSRRSVHGKHVIVTLGDQGLLWVSSSGAAIGWDGKAQSAAVRDIIELDDNTFAR